MCVGRVFVNAQRPRADRKYTMLRSTKHWLIRNVIRRGVLALSAPVAAGLRRYVPGNEAHDIFYRNGYHLLQKHYYLPIPEPEDLDDTAARGGSEMVGVEMNEAGALDLLKNVFPPHAEEFRRLFPVHKPEGGADGEQFYLLNGNFMAGDAHVYYALIRHLRPRRVVEIGSGYSTLVAARAVELMRAEGGSAPRLVAVEPYPLPFLKSRLAGLSELVEKKVQEADLEIFTSLGSGDILFIDSTHVLREGGDVQAEFCEILPRLAPGVFVHVHDISLPRPYPRVYFDEHHYYWNEQYLLQAFLAFNSRFEVVWPGAYMAARHPELIREVFPGFDAMREAFPSSEPSSFWMRVRE